MVSNNYILPRLGWEYLDCQTRDELTHDDVEDPAELPPPEATPYDDVNGYLEHYGMPKISWATAFLDDAMAHIVALLRKVEDEARGSKVVAPPRALHPLYPKEYDK